MPLTNILGFHRLVIEGDVVDLGGFKSKDSDRVNEAESKGIPWRSGSITGRPNSHLLESSSGRPYVLNGMIDIQTAEKRNVPPFIIQRWVAHSFGAIWTFETFIMSDPGSRTGSQTTGRRLLSSGKYSRLNSEASALMNAKKQ